MWYISDDHKEKYKRRGEQAFYQGNMLQTIKPDRGNECYILYATETTKLSWNEDLEVYSLLLTRAVLKREQLCFIIVENRKDLVSVPAGSPLLLPHPEDSPMPITHFQDFDSILIMVSTTVLSLELIQKVRSAESLQEWEHSLKHHMHPWKRSAMSSKQLKALKQTV